MEQNIVIRSYVLTEGLENMILILDISDCTVFSREEERGQCVNCLGIQIRLLKIGPRVKVKALPLVPISKDNHR